MLNLFKSPKNISDNIADPMVASFVKYCRNNLNLKAAVDYKYRSLSVCLIDCIYSLRAKYFVVTVPIVDRYAAKFMHRNKYAEGDTLKDLLNNIQSVGGLQSFTDKILQNHQKLGRDIPKEEVLVNLANALISLGINTYEDFRDYPDQELLELKIRSIKGLGNAAVNYIFMLAGDPNRCKPDVHIHHCILDACGKSVSDEICQSIFTDAVAYLKRDYPALTVRQLDGIIWQKYQANN